MALFVSFKDASDREFHIGDKGIKYISAEEVIEVQADGHELEYIQVNYSNIPFSKISCVQTWTGEFARFIIENWQ